MFIFKNNISYKCGHTFRIAIRINWVVSKSDFIPFSCSIYNVFYKKQNFFIFFGNFRDSSQTFGKNVLEKNEGAERFKSEK